LKEDFGVLNKVELQALHRNLAEEQKTVHRERAKKKEARPKRGTQQGGQYVIKKQTAENPQGVGQTFRRGGEKLSEKKPRSVKTGRAQ